jgi:hypothetical protein
VNVNRSLVVLLTAARARSFGTLWTNPTRWYLPSRQSEPLEITNKQRKNKRTRQTPRNGTKFNETAGAGRRTVPAWNSCERRAFGDGIEGGVRRVVERRTFWGGIVEG